MNTLIIAEKPSVARSIASALGATAKRDGYFEGKGYFVSFAFGHLYTLADTKDYNPDMGKWDLKHYPFIPSGFKYKPQSDAGVVRQINTIRELVARSGRVINACDGDREGELIFSELKRDLNIQKPIYRLWITSHTPKDIEKGMAALRPEMLSLESAGYCRQQIDWLIGINLTVVYTLKTGGELTLKVGRVMLPTLKLIFDREAEISAFKPKPFFTLKAIFTKAKDTDTYTGTYCDPSGTTKQPTSDSLRQIQKDIQGQNGIVACKESKELLEGPPRLFNLTDLQGHITSKYSGFSADKVLDIMQSLYEKGLLTYPRTASRHLNESQISEAREALNALLDNPGIRIPRPGEVHFHDQKSVFDDSKVDSHPAIIPTYLKPNLPSLTEQEHIVYLEVAMRFLSQFLPLAIYNTMEIETVVGEHHFITRGKVLAAEGWRQLYTVNKSKSETEEDEDRISAPGIAEGDTVETSGLELKEGVTKPPQHYSEKTLLSAMENCGKSVDSEEEVLKGFTIGTPATRADTIKKLADTGYIQFKGKNILITELGVKVIRYFPVQRLLKVDFTGRIEKTLKDMENGQYDPNEFMRKMGDFIRKNVTEMIAGEIPAIKKEVNVIGQCPECGKAVIENSKAFSCQGTIKGECKFALWKEDRFFARFGKKMTETIARSLLFRRRAMVKGMKSPTKEGVKFDAVVLLKRNQDTGYWNFELEFTDTPKKGRRRY